MTRYPLTVHWHFSYFPHLLGAARVKQSLHQRQAHNAVLHPRDENAYLDGSSQERSEGGLSK